LFPSPPGEISRTVQERLNHDLVFGELVDESISKDEQFAFRGIIEFRHEATSLSEFVERRCSLQGFLKNATDLVVRVLRNVRDDFVEAGPRGFRPDY
jgi:hypothetical protein